jgi:hypothetical protein
MFPGFPVPFLGNPQPNFRRKNMLTRERLIGTLQPALINEQARLEMKLKPAMIYRFIIDCLCLVTVPFGGGNAVEDNPNRFIREIRFETSDGVQIKAHSSTMQRFIQHYEKNCDPLTVGTLAGALAAGPYAIQFTTEVDFARGPALDPEETILNTNNYDNLTMIAQLGNGADFCDAAGTTVTLIQLNVTQVDRLPVSPEDEMEPRLINQLTRKVLQFTAAQQNLALDIPDKAEIDSIYVIARDLTLNHVLPERSDILVNNLRVALDNGNRIERFQTWAQMQQKNKEDFALENAIPGFAALSFDPDGDLKEMLDLRGVNSPQLLFDVNAPVGATGVGELEVGFRQIVTPQI